MKRRIREAIVVEGRYDKNALSQVVDAPIVTLDGYAVFHDREKLSYLRRLAARRGVILLTDSDGAGLVIRNYLKGTLPPEQVKQAYVPEISGKERRKRKPGKARLLGVEGMRPEVLLDALRRAGAVFLDETSLERADTEPDDKTDSNLDLGPADEINSAAKPENFSEPDPITKADLYAWGLSGGPDSAAFRVRLLEKLSLPRKLSANALLEALNLLYSRTEAEAFLRELQTREIVPKESKSTGTVLNVTEST